MFIRVKDKSTGHEFDVPETDPRIGKSLEHVKPTTYPPTRHPRLAKHYIQANPAAPETSGTDNDTQEEK